MSHILRIYTDGACKGNPGIGGWGVLMRWGKHETTFKGAEWETTNNRMELQAAISALEALKRPCSIILTTDSQYLRRGMLEWIQAWKRNGWKTKDKQDVKNSDLWKQLDGLVKHHHIEWRWIKGHSGHPENEYADQLANQAIEQLRRDK